MSLSDIASLLAVTIAAASGAFTYLVARQQVTIMERAETALFLEIFRSWNEIYPHYRELLSLPFDASSVISAHPTFNSYANTSEWLKMRSVFAFYEFIGSCIRLNLLKKEALFSLVTVDVDLWDKYFPLIRYYRDTAHRRDLYEEWEYLVGVRRLREASYSEAGSRATEIPRRKARL